MLPPIIRNPYFLIDVIYNSLYTHNIKCGEFKVMSDSPCQDIVINDKIVSTSNIELCYFDIVGKTINVNVNIVLNNHGDNISTDLIENIMSKYDKNDVLILNNNKVDETFYNDIYPYTDTKQVIIFNNIKSNKNTHLIELHKPTLLIFVNCVIPNIKVQYKQNQCDTAIVLFGKSIDKVHLLLGIICFLIIILLLSL